MSENEPNPNVNTELPPPDSMRTMSDLLGLMTFREYVDKVRAGLKEPKDSGEYKYARNQLLRVWAPVAGTVLPLIMVLAVALAPEPSAPPVTAFTVTMVDTKELEEEIEEIIIEPLPEEKIEEIEPPPLQELKPVDIQNMTDDQLLSGAVGPSVGPGSGTGAPAPGSEFSPQPALFDSVAMIRSPIKMPGIYSSRNPGARGKAISQYGGGGGGGGGGTEYAVYLALRWLKKYQEPDGSWQGGSGGGANEGGVAPAMTGLALLAFLAHGETPDAEEFGPTVERAIKYLVDIQDEGGHFSGSDNHEYSQPIATYALSEAFAMTQIPMVKLAAEKGATAIVQGQNAGALWDYNVRPSGRNDLSYSGWCMQAIKAAKIAGLEVPGIDACMTTAMDGIRAMRGGGNDGYAAFGYSRSGGGAAGGPWEITGAGVLCMQLLGGGKSQDAQDGLSWLSRASCDWATPWGGNNPIYHWYYITQAKFHAGGETWTSWNKQFSPSLVRNQTVIPSAIADTTGKLVDIGYWKAASQAEQCQSYVYNTALCALMLQVYYRYLPTFKTVEDVEAAPAPLTSETGEVDIQVM